MAEKEDPTVKLLLLAENIKHMEEKCERIMKRLDHEVAFKKDLELLGKDIKEVKHMALNNNESFKWFVRMLGGAIVSGVLGVFWWLVQKN